MRTEAIGAALGALAAPGDVICLSGELGAGKTVFSRGIGAGWGAAIPLSSPTYNLAHEHSRPLDDARLYHLDLYRVESAREADTLALDDILDSGDVVIFEWPERILDILPAERLWIDIAMRHDETRVLEFVARGERYQALINALCGAVPFVR
jgi:tRNA threonylcarbamoyladenosine biosynthesis protein TsaE